MEQAAYEVAHKEYASCKEELGIACDMQLRIMQTLWIRDT